VTLNNVTVVNSMPAANTAVLGPVTLAPGQSTNFTHTYRSVELQLLPGRQHLRGVRPRPLRIEDGGSHSH